ncbi:MAG: tetratricopeptide repeat protein [Elusimicrobia bacterium]|nr:tetratricopeptide repeat protein [Elusimicrobiota bacterium]
MKKLIEKKWFAISLIIIVTTIIYLPSLHAPFIFDDIAKIVENPDIKRLDNITTRLIYKYNENKNFKRNDPSRPLTYLTFTVNYYFGKLNPFGYHLFNLIVHILTSILIFILTRKIILYAYNKDSISLPFFVALFFAIHPVNTSSVSYVFSRSTVLMAFFYLSSLIFFVLAIERKKLLYYCISVLSFILALFSRQDAITLPVIILIFDYIFLSNFDMQKVIKNKYYYIIFGLLIIVFLLFRYFYFGGIGDLEAENLCKPLLYLASQCYVVLKYFLLLLVPIDVCIYRGVYYSVKTVYEPQIIVSFIVIMAVLIISWWLYKKRTSMTKIFLFSILWYFITLSPTSSFFSTTSSMVDNRLYISGFGFYLTIIILYFLLFSTKTVLGNNLNIISKLKVQDKMLISLLLIHIVLLSIFTFRRNQLFQQPILLWQDVISKYPNNIPSHINLGDLLRESKRYNEAEKEYREAINLNQNCVDVHYKYGLLLEDLKRYNEAEKEYIEEIKIKPDNEYTHNSLGSLFKNLKRFKEAEDEYRVAIKINTNYAEAHFNLGVLLNDTKRFEGAEKEYREALRINPNYIEARNNLGTLLYNSKKLGETENELRILIEINPHLAQSHYNLGFLLHNLKRFDEAVKEYKEAIRLNPNYTKAHNNLGILYYEQKEYFKSLQEFEIALSLAPNDKDIQNKVNFLKQLVTGNKSR